jgi:hypothetical protein
MKNIKKRITVLSIVLVVGVFVSLNIYNKNQKYNALLRGMGISFDTDVEVFYLNYGYFPTSCSEAMKPYRDRGESEENIEGHMQGFLTDPFTKEPYKLILVKSDIKERNGILALSAGFNGVFDNKESEIAIEDFHKLSLIKKEVNNWDYKPSLLEYIISDTDIVVFYWCDEFQYLEGSRQFKMSSLQKHLIKYRTRNSVRRLFLKGKIESLDLSSNSLELSIDSIKHRFYELVNMEGVSVGDSINISALFDPFVKEEFIKCKIYDFDMNSANITHYRNGILNEIGLSLYMSEKYQLEGSL